MTKTYKPLSLGNLTTLMVSGAPDNALTRLDDGSLQIGSFTLTPTGLAIAGEANESEWHALGATLHRLQGAIQWLIGDWLVYGERVWGKTYEQVAETFGYDVNTLRSYASVCKHVQIMIRNHDLSFAHHRLVMSMEIDVQRKWLHYAFAVGLSVEDMRQDKIALLKTNPTDDQQIDWLAYAISQNARISQLPEFQPPSPTENIRQFSEDERELTNSFKQKARILAGCFDGNRNLTTEQFESIMRQLIAIGETLIG